MLALLLLCTSLQNYYTKERTEAELLVEQELRSHNQQFVLGPLVGGVISYSFACHLKGQACTCTR